MFPLFHAHQEPLTYKLPDISPKGTCYGPAICSSDNRIMILQSYTTAKCQPSHSFRAGLTMGNYDILEPKPRSSLVILVFMEK